MVLRGGLNCQRDMHMVGLAIASITVYDALLCVTFRVLKRMCNLVTKNVSLEITT